MSTPPPGIGIHPSPSEVKIDHLLSVPIPSAGTIQLDQYGVTGSGGGDRTYHPKAPSITSSKAQARYDSPRWSPFHLRPLFLLGNVVVLLDMALVVELLYFLNDRSHGWTASSFLLKHPVFAPYLAVLPALLAWILVSPWMEINRLVKLLQPYVNMSASRTLADQSVLLNYNDRPGIFLLPKLIRNRHIAPLLTTGICILAALVVPFSAGYIRLSSEADGVFTAIKKVTQTQQLYVPYSIPLTGLNAGASWVSAAATYGVPAPSLILFDGAFSYSVSEVGIDDAEVTNGLISVNTIVIQSEAQCQIATGIDVSNGIINGVGYGCGFHINTTSTSTSYMDYTDTPATFGMTAIQCTGSSPASISPVVFWEDYTDGSGDTQTLVTTCMPKVISYRGDVLMNATTRAVLSVENLGPLWEADMAGLNLTTEVTDGQVIAWSSPLNSTALNALFLDYPEQTDQNLLSYMHTTMGTAIDTLLRNNLDSGEGFGYVGAHLDACEIAYGNFLGIANRQIYFETIAGLRVPGGYHSDALKVYISASVTHVLFIMLISMAVMGAYIAKIQRQNNQTLRLYAAPGSLASSVACAAASDLPVILRSSDTKADMKSVLQEYTFTLNKDTGGLVLGDRDPGTMPSPTHIPMTGAASWMKKKFHPHSSA